MNNAKYITHWQQCLSPQFMFQQPCSMGDNLYLSMQALSYKFRSKREGICRHLICFGLVGKTMGASGVMCDFPFPFRGPWSNIMRFSFFFMETTCGKAHLQLKVWTRLFFLIHCHSFERRTNKDHFWQPEKSNRRCHSFSWRKGGKHRVKGAAYTVSSLNTYPLHLANTYTHTDTHTPRIIPRSLLLPCLFCCSTRTFADTSLRKEGLKRGDSSEK